MRHGSALGPLVALLSGCGSGGHPYAIDVGGDEGGTPAFVSTDASASSDLDAYIEQGHMQVKFIRLSCSGQCADVQAVGTGGNPPYSYRWEDGSTSPTRHVCPTSSTSYSVTVTDTGTSGEFARAPETVKVPLPANVSACPDGGGSGVACISNPSFEGTVSSFYGHGVCCDVLASTDAPPWVTCQSWPGSGIVNASLADSTFAFPSPADGATYLSLFAGGICGSNGTAPCGPVSELLCQPMHAGTPYSLKVDLFSPDDAATGVSPVSLQILGSAGSCSQGQLLWSSPTPGPSWKTYCATFTPAEETPYLQLATTGAPAGSGALFVDHIVPVATCP